MDDVVAALVCVKTALAGLVTVYSIVEMWLLVIAEPEDLVNVENDSEVTLLMIGVELYVILLVSSVVVKSGVTDEVGVILSENSRSLSFNRI